ncbi:MAG: phospholipase D family protein [Acidobacteriota bacterium]|nr:phospholipase D family protein [Acidobacteriota bacterium]
MGKIRLGQDLLRLCTSAKQELWLVAPFIKRATLEQILREVTNDISIKCFTRWRPEEIASGISDLDIWLLLRERPKAKLFLKYNLHAKYYRADNHCLVGSANLTHTALGWSSSSNLELLIPARPDEPILRTFEEELESGCIIVDDDIYEHMKTSVKQLYPSQSHLQEVVIRKDLLPMLENTTVEVDLNTWVPRLRHPEDLYLVYSNQRERLTAVSWEIGKSDLAVLDIPPSLVESAFKTYVGSVLLQMPIIRRIDELLVTPQNFGSVTKLLNTLAGRGNLDFDAQRAWQTMIRWLLYFLPHRYSLSVPNYSEIFRRVPQDFQREP